jgi:hypothetical protein
LPGAKWLLTRAVVVRQIHTPLPALCHRLFTSLDFCNSYHFSGLRSSDDELSTFLIAVITITFIF